MLLGSEPVEPGEPETVTEMRRRMTAALEEAETFPGVVNFVKPQMEYGQAGVLIGVSWLHGEGEVTAKLLWVHIALVPDLLAVVNQLHSEEFIEEMDRLIVEAKAQTGHSES